MFSILFYLSAPSLCPDVAFHANLLLFMTVADKYLPVFKLTVLLYIEQHPGPEPDLTATLPMDPREYSNAFSPPIVLPSQKRSSGEWCVALTPFLTTPPQKKKSPSLLTGLFLQSISDLKA